MQQLTRFEEFRWIEEGRLKLIPWNNPDWNGNFVAHCLPPIFPAYAKIFHPMYEDLELKGTSVTWDEENKLLRQLQAPPGNPVSKIFYEALSNSTLVMRSGPCPKSGRRIRWQELAHQFGLQFHAEINDTSFTRIFPKSSWPRYLIGPAEGDLAIESCANLATILERYTQSQTCYFYYLIYATKDCGNPLLFQGHLGNVFEALKYEKVRSSPSWWWPSDHSWCVSTDWDLTFTLVGGPESLIAELIANPELECLQVTSESRVDSKGDLRNQSLKE